MSHEPNVELLSITDVRKMLREYKPSVWTKLRWRVKAGYWKLRNFLFPKQQWLRKVIPNRWCDKPELLTDVIYAFITDYVEGERAFEVIEWSQEKESADFIRSCYHWIRIGRPNLIDEIDRELTAATGRGEELDYLEKYGRYEMLEKDLRDKDTKMMIEIVKIRGVLWT